MATALVSTLRTDIPCFYLRFIMGDFEAHQKSEMKAKFSPSYERKRIWEWFLNYLQKLPFKSKKKIQFYSKELEDSRIHVLVWCNCHKVSHSIDVVFVSIIFHHVVISRKHGVM